MPSASEAREWVAAGGLHGIGDSLYTPFSGRDGDEIDWDAYRRLVRYCVGDLAPRHAVAHQRYRRVVVADDGGAQDAPRGGGRRSTAVGPGDGDPGVHHRPTRPRTRSSSPCTPKPPGPTSATCRRRRWRSTPARACCGSSSTSPIAATSRSGCSTRRRRDTC